MYLPADLRMLAMATAVTSPHYNACSKRAPRQRQQRQYDEADAQR
jgi:hypothetical protein